ncbi:carbohydrate esterase family 12 protein [Moniliophthora roreri MCA 2997]|uniref:Carbohydrate esterase family 12 protein n=1 Tax=Moniliophthora roreri (strain MCA 2997) TaxID=1381753 RepID=V2YSM2_MONRO|nr:carbohydrate esterase family 12 protein [Moniliophthora roreri MCA 2997]
MMFKLVALFVLFLSVSAIPAVAPASSFILIGDSTTANGTTENSGGWGNGFCGSTVTSTPSALEPNTPCINTAKNGATTGTFVANGYWDLSIKAIKSELAKGRKTYATIQFGHNDQKVADPASMGRNLTSMVQQIRSLGAEPILVTSLTRRSFNSDGTISDTLGPWADETKLVAQQQNVHVLDLHAASITYCQKIGPDAAHRLNRTPDDNTHLNANGTIVFGRMLADLMKASFPGQLPIIENSKLSNEIAQGIPSY